MFAGAFAYARWDGTQHPEPFTPEALLDSLTEAILAEGDLEAARRRGLADGLELDGQALPGLDELLRRLRALGHAPGSPELLADLVAARAELEQARRVGSVDPIDVERLRRLLGDEAVALLERFGEIVARLTAAGLLRADGERLELSAAAIRRIGLRALADVFGSIAGGVVGRHRSRRPGRGGERTDETRPFAFGDPFLLDVQRTLFNALRRAAGSAGEAPAIRLRAEDFEVVATERAVGTATALLIDTSRSMLSRGCFAAAKKVGVALETLIRTRYPSDALYVIAFADAAREIEPERIALIDHRQVAQGTNVQDALALGRRRLDRHRAMHRQILLLTDGEPTAWVEDGRRRLAYPPTFQTLRATLREVGRCTRERITINTFMLDRRPALTDFVHQMTRINRGRAFYSGADDLGRYVLVDFVAGRDRRIG